MADEPGPQPSAKSSSAPATKRRSLPPSPPAQSNGSRHLQLPRSSQRRLLPLALSPVRSASTSQKSRTKRQARSCATSSQRNSASSTLHSPESYPTERPASSRPGSRLPIATSPFELLSSLRTRSSSGTDCESQRELFRPVMGRGRASRASDTRPSVLSPSQLVRPRSLVHSSFM